MEKQTTQFKNRKYWLIIIPIVYLLLSTVLKQQTANYYQNNLDPEYAILYNGILVASGNLAINFIAHPATPLIYISGIADRIVNLFTTTSSLKEDFLNSPEKYLTASITFNYLLIFLTLLFVGHKVFQYSNSITVVILLQLSVFLSADILAVGVRLIPEATMVIPLLIMMSLSIKYLFQKTDNVSPYLWQFPLLIAFGIGCKLSFAPMLIFPLILLKTTWKEKGKLILTTLLFCCLFAYPLLSNFKESFSWIFNMFTHSGLHGQGAENFISTSTISADFMQLISHHPLFHLLILSSILPIILISFLKKKNVLLLRIKKASLALLVTISLIVLFTLKHFALHYIIPFYSLIPLGIILNFLTLKELPAFDNNNKQNYLSYGFIVISLIFCIPSLTEVQKWSMNAKNKTAVVNQKASIIKSLMTNKNAGLIVAPSYWGSPFISYAHCYGFMHSYRRKNFFKKELREKYPNFYCYVDWTDKFNHWDEFVDFKVIFSKNKEVYLYFGEETKALPNIQNRLKEASQDNIHVRQTILFQAENTSELLLKLTLIK